MKFNIELEFNPFPETLPELKFCGTADELAYYESHRVLLLDKCNHICSGTIERDFNLKTMEFTSINLQYITGFWSDDRIECFIDDEVNDFIGWCEIDEAFKMPLERKQWE